VCFGLLSWWKLIFFKKYLPVYDTIHVRFPLPPAESPEHVSATLDSNCGTLVSAYVWLMPDITFGFRVRFSVVRLQYFLLKGFSLVTLPKSGVKCLDSVSSFSQSVETLLVLQLTS